MENTLVETIYEGEHYMIPHDELGSWCAYIKDLSIFVKDAGHLQIAFSDEFSRYRVVNIRSKDNVSNSLPFDTHWTIDTVNTKHTDGSKSCKWRIDTPNCGREGFDSPNDALNWAKKNYGYD